MLVRIAVEKLEECEALAKDNTLRKMKDVLKNESRAEAELLFEQWQTKSKPKIWMAKKTNGQGPPTMVQKALHLIKREVQHQTGRDIKVAA